MKTEEQIIELNRKYSRKSFLGVTLKENAKIRRSLVKAINVLYDLRYLSEEDEKVLNVLEEILYPKSRQPYFYNEGDIRDPDNIGINCTVGEIT